MFAALIISASFVSQALPTPPAPEPPAAKEAAPSAPVPTFKQRRAEAAARHNARVRHAQAAQAAANEAAGEQLLYQERMAAIYAQQQATQAQAYYNYQAGQAMQNLGVAARQDAETNRLRYLSRYGPGPLMILNAPRVVTPTEVIQSQLAPR